MRTIKCQVRCEGWERPDPFEVEVPKAASQEEIDEAIFDAAVQAAGFEYWIEGE